MDSTIGLTLNQSRMHGNPVNVIDIDNDKEEYQYKSEKTGCEWAYIVSKESLVIELKLLPI